jgi:hypothetical protein
MAGKMCKIIGKTTLFPQVKPLKIVTFATLQGRINKYGKSG